MHPSFIFSQIIDIGDGLNFCFIFIIYIIEEFINRCHCALEFVTIGPICFILLLSVALMTVITFTSFPHKNGALKLFNI